MRGYPGGRGSRAERLLPPCPDPSPGVSGSVPSLGPPLAAQAAVLHWLLLHITEAGAHSGCNQKQIRGDKDLYVLGTFLLNIIDFTVSCSFLLRVSLNLALHEPFHPVPCFPFPEIQYLFKFKK